MIVLRHMRHLVAFEGLYKGFSSSPVLDPSILDDSVGEFFGIFRIYFPTPRILGCTVFVCAIPQHCYTMFDAALMILLCSMPSLQLEPTISAGVHLGTAGWACNRALRIQVFMRTAWPGPRIHKLSSNDFKPCHMWILGNWRGLLGGQKTHLRLAHRTAKSCGKLRGVNEFLQLAVSPPHPMKISPDPKVQ